MDIDLPLGARALGDFNFCKRLFHLEHVDGYWTDTEETRLGRLVHARVDVAKSPDAGQRVASGNWIATSMKVFSDELGVVAVCDVVVAQQGKVRPVEFRRGSPRNDGEPWHSDRMQLLCQIVVLRHSGYPCDHGFLWYAETRSRVRVDWSAEAETELRRSLHKAREVATSSVLPPPLQHSKKCERCALLPVCLPDEINLLSGRDEAPPRRLLAAAPESQPLYIVEPGSRLGVRGGRLHVTRARDELASLQLRDVLHVVVAGPSQVTTQAIHALAEQDTPVVWTTTGGWMKAVTIPSLGSNVDLRRRQHTISPQRAVDFSRRLVGGKIRNCRTLLRRNSHHTDPEALKRLDTAIRSADRAQTVTMLRGIEGAAARTYFDGLPHLFRPDHRLPGPGFADSGRTRRPPRDAVSCLLSFLYALLVKDVTVACYGLGLDPYAGVYHQDRFGRPALALDLMEEFRPQIADSTALTLINTRQADAGLFHVRPDQVTLTQSGKRRVIDAYEHRMTTEIRHPLFKYTVTYRRALELQARLFAAYLLEEFARYRPFTSR
ncbi:CRISPR-associated endonuclease Cas4/Cas1 [Saccharopolyspora flava]|uniref:CRISPR-associated endonuclease Cas1 n=1 Tax=Saccharopolyspora flava TaxID=95161 RepID=A0A1I6UJU6_9PSEU|nr:CRISPR-associated endonuclease Cas4/Cas1 [Saccharopolyspora flava]SFT01698.1 CRISPR-associated protein, Cas1 family/CRISPR-associated exonuclease, Cas4 family [Saccharopolyspora flava]